MGKHFFLIAYGMAWGYYIHAKEIDKKLAAVGRELWEDHVRNRVRIEMSECDRQMAIRFPDISEISEPAGQDPHPEGVKIVAAG